MIVSFIAQLSTRQLVQYGAAWLFFGLFALQLGLIVVSGELGLWALIAAFLAMYLADALSGIVHFILDYTPTPTNRGLKELFYFKGSKGSEEYTRQRAAAMKRINAFEEMVFDFKIHHISPGTLGRRPFLRLTLPVIYFSGLPMSVLTLGLYGFDWISTEWFIFLSLLTAGTTICQYAHACAHKKKVPPVPALLQRLGLFVTAQKHHSHHLNLGHDFCMLNGWSNPLVNRIFQQCLKRGWFDTNNLTPK